MKTSISLKHIVLKNYDLVIKALLAMLIDLFVASCDKPDEEPQPEYGVVPMYGVPTSVMNEQKPA